MSVLLVSFMRDSAFWRENSRKMVSLALCILASASEAHRTDEN